MDRMNLADVAKRAKVSTATVSRVLNNAGVVRSSTRARVLKAVEELKYYPNIHARTLAGGKSRTLGMIVSNLGNPFFLDIFRALEALAHSHGYEVLVANTDYRSPQLVTSVRLMIGRRVAGLAVVVSEMEPSLIRELEDSRIPVVFYDVGTPKRNITNIRVNYRRGMQKMVEYLHDLGHTRMAFVGHHTTLEPLNDRKASFLETMHRYSPHVEFMTVADQDSLEGGRQAARELLASSFQATAILCVNDLMAVGVLRELRDQGRRVPQEVSVTGFDNIALSEFASPALTTAHIPREKIGQLAFESLVASHSEPRPMGRDIRIDPELVVRESTGPAPKDASASERVRTVAGRH